MDFYSSEFPVILFVLYILLCCYHLDCVLVYAHFKLVVHIKKLKVYYIITGKSTLYRLYLYVKEMFCLRMIIISSKTVLNNKDCNGNFYM